MKEFLVHAKMMPTEVKKMQEQIEYYYYNYHYYYYYYYYDTQSSKQTTERPAKLIFIYFKKLPDKKPERLRLQKNSQCCIDL